VRRTVPLVMAWTGIFVLSRVFSNLLVDGANQDVRWRLVDLWNNLYLVGLWCLGADRDTLRPKNQPEYWEALLACGAVCVAAGLYLRKRIRAVEVIG
jgi:ABC-2 type transport system permease protein